MQHAPALISWPTPDGRVMYMDTTCEQILGDKLAEVIGQELLPILYPEEQIIAIQAVALVALSTPLIPISEGVVVMPLIGSIDEVRARQIMETLLSGISRSQARTAILDITGVATVDHDVAHALLQAARAARMLGAQIVLTGIRPEVAQTLVSLGTHLEGIVTRGTLQSGIAFALAREQAGAKG